MEINWTTKHTFWIDEKTLDNWCDEIREAIKNGCYKDQLIIDLVYEEIRGYDDDIYYAWGEDQTEEVVKEIKRRLGGVQLSMFNDPFGVPEDYNEGWK